MAGACSSCGAGLHYYSLNYILSGLLVHLPRLTGPPMIITAGFVYLLLSVRAVYCQSWARTLGKSVVLFIAVILAEVAMVVGALFITLKSQGKLG